MHVSKSNHNLIEIGKRQYRNPIYLAKKWRQVLDNREYASPAALARHLRVSRARVTQILNLLKLSPEVIEMIASLGDSFKHPSISEGKISPLLALTDDQQMDHVNSMLENCRAKP